MSVMLIEFRNFKEKIAITRRYYGKAKMQILDNRYVYIEMKGDIRR